MTVNPTDKPDLPDDISKISQLNLTIPIRSSKLLVETARELRKYYYFSQLPGSWIEIPSIQTHYDKPLIPQHIDELKSQLDQINPELKELIPIQDRAKATEIIERIKSHFTLHTIPEYLLVLPDLPEPDWDIFDNYTPPNPYVTHTTHNNPTDKGKTSTHS